MITTLAGRVGAARGSIAIYLVPIVAIVLGAVFLGERVAPLALAGTALVIFGAYVTSRAQAERARRRPRSSTREPRSLASNGQAVDQVGALRAPQAPGVHPPGHAPPRTHHTTLAGHAVDQVGARRAPQAPGVHPPGQAPPRTHHTTPAGHLPSEGSPVRPARRNRPAQSSQRQSWT